MSSIRCVVIMLAAVARAMGASGQPLPDGTLVGTVRDVTGSVMIGARVAVTAPPQRRIGRQRPQSRRGEAEPRVDQCRRHRRQCDREGPDSRPRQDRQLARPADDALVDSETGRNTQQEPFAAIDKSVIASPAPISPSVRTRQ